MFIFGGRFAAFLLLILCCAQEQAADRAPVREERVPRISERVPGELIVRFKPGATDAKRTKALQKAKGVSRDLVRPGFRRLAGARLTSAEETKILKVEGNVELAKAALENDPDVLYVEPNYKTRVFAAVIPNDFEFELLYGLHNIGQSGGKAGADIKAPEAWEITKGSTNILVAVVDTGIDYFHEDLRANIWVNRGEIPGNGVDDDGNGYIDDIYGYDFISNDNDPMDDHFHGTHVAGTIGGVADNGRGVAGVCWQTRMMAIKAFDQAGNGTVESAIGALHYAVVNGARIINASWGLEDRSRALADAVAETQAAGIVFIAAAGNAKTDTAFFPAGFDSVIAVAATNNKDQRSDFSNYGRHIDLSAPGEQILSTVPDSKYDLVSGTSMSAPHVTGVAALILSRHPEFTVAQVTAILKNTTDPIRSDVPIGRGRVNAFAAVQVDVPLPNAKLNVTNVVSGLIDFRGTASGDHFQRYTLSYGEGAQPTNWTEFSSSTTQVANGLLLGGFDSSALNDGIQTFKLQVWNDNGQSASDLVTVGVVNVQISSPFHADILRHGPQIVLKGTVFGQGRRYGISWSEGPRQLLWSTVGIAQPSNTEVQNGVLATFDSSRVASNAYYSFKLSATNANGAVQNSYAHYIWLDSRLRPGFPIYAPHENEVPFEDWRQAKVVDLDGDGRKEIIIVDHGNSQGKIAKLLVYRDDGTLAWSRELNGDEPYADVPTIGDVDGDGKPEIFVDVGAKLYAFTYNGGTVPGLWPITLSAKRLGKILADLDGDGDLELIAFANKPHENTPSQVSLTIYDKGGIVLQHWTVPACSTPRDGQRSFPVAANFDDDPALEIVVASGCNGVSLYDLDRPGPVWVTGVNGSALNSPVVGDVDHDGRNDIVVATWSARKGVPAGVYLLNREGEIQPGWPVLIDDSFETSPALGDVNDDGTLEICVMGQRSARLHLLQYDGFAAPGWPVIAQDNTPLGSPVFANLLGSAAPEIILVAPGYTYSAFVLNDPGSVGGVFAWTATGQQINLGGWSRTIPVENSSVLNDFKAAPATLTDLDGNGKIDLIATSIRDIEYVPTEFIPVLQTTTDWFKRRNSIYAWEFNTPFNDKAGPWAEFQHGPDNNAFLPAETPPPDPPILLKIPDQIVAVGQTFQPIALNQYLMFHGPPVSNLTWTATGQSQLTVQIDAASVARVLTPSPAWEGSERITFTVTDGATFTFSTNALYTTRLGYVPPILLPDTANVVEDGAIEIDVLANDSNPGGGSLFLREAGQSSHGKVQITPQNTIIYTPGTNYFGLDTFAYRVENSVGASSLSRVTIVVLPVNDRPFARDDRALTFEDRAVVIDALANDSDADDEPISIVSLTQPANGSAVVNANNKIVFQPNSGFNGTNIFTYSASDGRSEPVIARITVVVRPLNSAPIAKPQDIVMNRNANKDIIYLAEDLEGDALTFRIIKSPLHGELYSYPTVGNYVPYKGYSGTDSFTYKASDGLLEGPEATVRITILDTNNPPTAPPATITARFNQSTPITLAATDIDGDPLTFRLGVLPRHGVLIGSHTNYLYTPDRNYMGKDDFTFIVSDLKNEVTGKVNIELTDKNSAPGANPKLVRTTPNTPVSFKLTGADSESDPLRFTLTTQPKFGALTGSAPDLTYTPNLNYLGPDRFRFTVSDAEFTSEPAAVTFSIAEKNTLPVATNQTVIAYSGTSPLIKLAVKDADGDPLQCVILKGPRYGRLAGAGTTFLYTFGPVHSSVDTFTYKPWDGHNYGNEAVVRIERSSQPPPITPPEFKSIQIAAAGMIQLSITNEFGRVFSLEHSPDLTNWFTLTNVTSSGLFFYAAPVTNVQTFFRARNSN